MPDWTKLSTNAKLDLIEKIWGSITESPAPVQISDALKTELARRHEEYLRDPSQAVDWKEAKAQILADHAKRKNPTPSHP